MHGGDIYTNRVKIDFSVNINPQGVPEGVRSAVLDSVNIIEQYPDINSSELKASLAEYFSVGRENIAVGNGASELIMAAFQALRPGGLVITAPDFSGYLRAASAVGCETQYVYIINEKRELKAAGEIVDELLDRAGGSLGSRVESRAEGRAGSRAEGGFVMLTNPNNPSGLFLEKEALVRLAEGCRDRGLILGVDESFLPFTEAGEEAGLKDRVEEYPIMIFKSFTKLFAMPGVRLGMLLGRSDLIAAVETVLPEWNISAAANAAGLAALKEREYIAATSGLISAERTYLTGELRRLGLEVFPSAANYLLIRSDRNLYKELLARGLLIRDCADYEGLGEGYYRLAVRTHKENELLIAALREIFTII